MEIEMDRDGDGDGDISTRKQQEEDIVTCIPPFTAIIYPRLVVEKVYKYSYTRYIQAGMKNRPISKRIHPDRRRIRKVSSAAYLTGPPLQLWRL